MRHAIIAVLLFVGLASARADEWELTDKVLLGTAEGALAFDWLQTRSMPTRINADGSTVRMNESNPFLGKHPSTGRVNAYFAGAALGTVALAYVLPPTQRRWFLGGVTVMETAVIVHNHMIGIRLAY